MIYYFIYFLFSPLFFLVIYIGALFNKKIFKHLKNQKKSFEELIKKINNIDRIKIKVLIFHAASAGEFEQLKPILKNINREKYFTIQTFTSPTIYENEFDNNLFDVSCYHPLDFPWSAFFFLNSFKPTIYLTTRHDIWPHHLVIAKLLKIKCYLINANLYNNSKRFYPIFKSFNKFIFKC